MGKQRIVISEQDNIAALFEDDVAVEFIIHRGDVLLGDVYLAQVENILPSIDAAFVNVGTERMGFLHSSDVLGKGDLKSRLQPKQNLVVQVMKEPTGHKGPRVTQNIALPGRFLVMLPESKGISISRKILDNKERARLKSILSLIKPPGVGIIIRTEAENQSEPEIQEDFETLLERWQNIVAMADTVKPPTLLYRDQDLLYRVIRELVTEDVKEIVVDTAFGQQRAQHLLQNWGIDQPIKVSLHQGPQNIMVGMGIDKEIKMALQTRVPLPSGGYLYIQPTEALTVVDVNSGKFTSLESQAETIRLTNLEASKEIARQLRLRNIGGMIIVDFIDMESRANQLSVLQFFEQELANDKAKPQIGQLSDLGLVEMTRHRQGQSLSEIFTKKCIACTGAGLTLEEFNWAPSAQEMARGRSKMPIRKPQVQPAVSQHPTHGAVPTQGGQQQRGGAVPRPGASGLRKLLLTVVDAMPIWENFINASQKLAEKEEKSVTDGLPIAELYRYRLERRHGLRFANTAKLARLPIGINAIMIRINPHANDVFTLVDAIEGSSIIPPMDMDEEETDAGDNGGDESEESPEAPTWTDGDTNGTVAARTQDDEDEPEDDEARDEAAIGYAASFLEDDEAPPTRGKRTTRTPVATDEDDESEADDDDETEPNGRRNRYGLDEDDLVTSDDEDEDDENEDEDDDDVVSESAAPKRRGSRAAAPKRTADKTDKPPQRRRGRAPKREADPVTLIDT